MIDRGCIRPAGVLLVALLLMLAAGCTPDHPQSTFDTAGPVARSQVNLFYLIFGVAAFVFVAVEGVLVYTAVRYRRRRDQGDPEQIHGHTKLEVAWTIAPALVLLVVAVPTVLTVFNNANAPPETKLTVDAIGHQWWFEFRYTDPSDAGREIVTANELHVPVGEPVFVRLDSVDVIHSFWLPKIAGKVDMIPNSNNHMWVRADEPGEYLGQCAEFCGVSHAKMRFRVIAEDRDIFDTWLASQAAPAVEPTDPLRIQGQALFTSAGCSGCHSLSSIINRPAAGSNLKRIAGRVGPNLAHFASRGHIVAGTLEQTPFNLRKWLEDPDKVKPGNVMARDAKVFSDPDSALTEPQISALVAFLRGLE